MPSYIVVSHLLRNGKDYAPGSNVNMGEVAAAGLLARGVISPAPDQKITSALTVPELLERLAELKVVVPPGARKADLVSLYDQAIVSAEDGQP